MKDTIFTKLDIPMAEMDYLMTRYDFKSHGDAISWGIKLLFDLSKAQEQNWHLTLQKSDFTDEGLKVDPNYRQSVFKLDWLRSAGGSCGRISVDKLEKLNKKF